MFGAFTEKRKFFCIVNIGRSGSHFLRGFLNSHPQICCQSEMFHPNPVTRSKKWLRGNYSFLLQHPLWKFLRKIAPEVLMDVMFNRLYTYDCLRKNKSNLGFLVLYREFKIYPEIIPWIKRHHFKIIHLVRQNQLKALASWSAAVQTNVWETTKPVPWQPIDLEPQNIVRDLRQRYQAINDFRTQCSGLPYLEVNYESLVSQPQQELAKVLEFLGEEECPLVSDQVKISPDEIGKLIKNYVQISAVLKGTEFHTLLK